jgi:hypothetical protein
MELSGSHHYEEILSGWITPFYFWSETRKYLPLSKTYMNQHYNGTQYADCKKLELDGVEYPLFAGIAFQKLSFPFQLPS